MVHIVEKALYIDVYDIVKLVEVDKMLDSCYCVMSCSHRSETVVVSIKMSFCNGFERLFETLFDNSIQNTWYAERSLFSVRFGDEHASDLFRSIIGQFLPNKVYNFFFCSDFDIVYRLAVSSGGFRAFIVR